MSESNRDSGAKGREALHAAALKYDQNINAAPQVVAAGTGYMAQKILQVAAENGVAIYHDDSAATLLTKLELGQEIPPELYQIVVDIYIALMDAALGKEKIPEEGQDAEGEPEAEDK